MLLAHSLHQIEMEKLTDEVVAGFLVVARRLPDGDSADASFACSRDQLERSIHHRGQFRRLEVACQSSVKQ